MAYMVNSTEEAQALADRIRAGEVPQEEMDAALSAIEKFSATIQRDDLPEQEQDEKLNFFQRMGENLEKRNEMFWEVTAATRAGEQSVAEGTLQVAGKYGAGLVMDFLGEAAVSAGRGLAFVTPGDWLGDNVKKLATHVGHAFAETDIGQAGIQKALEGVEAYTEWSEANPRAARNLEAVVNIGMLAAPVKGKPKTSITRGGKVSDRIRLTADNTEFKRRDKFLKDLALPMRLPSEMERRVAQGLTETSGSGFLKRTKLMLDPTEEHAITLLQRLPSVSPKNFLVENHRAIKTEIGKLGNELTRRLKAKDVAYPVKELRKELDNVKAAIAKDTTVIGDARGAAEGLVDTYMKLVLERPNALIAGQRRGLLSDLLAVRKDIDAQFRRAGREPSRFAEYGTAENGQMYALDALRRTVNQFVHDRARPGTNVKQMLKDQAALYRVADNLVPKAAAEASTKFGQIWSRALKLLPLRGEINQFGALAFGMGGLGAGAVLGPAMSKALFGFGAGWGTWAALTHPASRRGLALMIDAMKPKNLPRMTAEQAHRIRADRAYLIDLLKSAETEDFATFLHPAQVNEIINDDDEKKREDLE